MESTLTEKQLQWSACRKPQETTDWLQENGLRTGLSDLLCRRPIEIPSLALKQSDNAVSAQISTLGFLDHLVSC